ncbi:MAG: hypothetical protein R3Y28_02625 [Candidatus Gastranaerophilales bacterium]
MKCHVCKKTIPENTLKCEFCNSRTGMTCPNCETINTLDSFICKNCGYEILKVCPNCKSVNHSNATNCRKCNSSLEIIEIVEEEQGDLKIEKPKQFSCEEIINKLCEKLPANDKKIFSIAGESGSGKTFILKQVMNQTAELENTWLYGKCTPITQLSSGGLIQDVLLNLFNLPDICVNEQLFKKDSSRFFMSEFPELTQEEVYELINFLYPQKKGVFEDILQNKNRTFEILFKVFSKIATDNEFILTIDNLDMIDGFSFEFINNLIKHQNIYENIKLILLYNEQKPSKGFFLIENNPEQDLYFDFYIKSINKTEAQKLINIEEKKLNIQLSQEEKSMIFGKSKGNPNFIKHAIELKKDCQTLNKDFELRENFKNIIIERLEILATTDPITYKAILIASILGNKINIALLKEIANVDDELFVNIINKIEKMGYISQMNDIFYEFNNITIWEIIVNQSKNYSDFMEINNSILACINPFRLSTVSILGIIAQNVQSAEFALNIWTINTRLSAYIGDTNLYVLAQKQSLMAIGQQDLPELKYIKQNIYEKLGKLLTTINPKEAMQYLPEAISQAEIENNTPRIVELLSYMTTCCNKTGNYYGEIECVNKVLEKVNKDDLLEYTFIKCTKLNALLNIGNCGELTNLISNEIMPVFDDFFSNDKKHDNISTNFVFITWLKSYLILAKAYVHQGNEQAFEVLTVLFDMIESHNIQNELFVCHCNLTLAHAYTMQGDFEKSEVLLTQIEQTYGKEIMDNEAIIKWNFINILNKFLQKKYNNIQEELFEIVTFANNNNDNFTKNILKTLLGKVFFDEDKVKQALEIYNKQITYFSQEKIALGAILTWYLIAEATMITDGPEATIEIAQQALVVTENPKINNHFFAILLKSLIANAFITLSDFESAKLYLEEAIEVAQRYNMKDQLSRLYLLYGKKYQEMGLKNSPEQEKYIDLSAKMYERTQNIIAITKNIYLAKKLNKSKETLKTFCLINSIIIPKALK